MGHGMEIDRMETSKVIESFGSSMEELNKVNNVVLKSPLIRPSYQKNSKTLLSELTLV